MPALISAILACNLVPIRNHIDSWDGCTGCLLNSLEWIQCILCQSGYLAPLPTGSLKIYTSSVREEPLKGKRHWRRYQRRQSPLFLVLLQLPDGDHHLCSLFPTIQSFRILPWQSSQACRAIRFQNIQIASRDEGRQLESTLGYHPTVSNTCGIFSIVRRYFMGKDVEPIQLRPSIVERADDKW